MTFIRPHEHFNLSTLLFAAGGFLFAAEMAMMIYFYNKTVNFEAAIGKAKDETQQVEAQNAILERKAIAALDGSLRFTQAYSALTEETHPEYLNVHPHTNTNILSDAQ